MYVIREIHKTVMSTTVYKSVFLGPSRMSSKGSTCLCVLSFLHVTLSRQGTCIVGNKHRARSCAHERGGQEDTSPGLLQRQRMDGRGTYKQTFFK